MLALRHVVALVVCAISIVSAAAEEREVKPRNAMSRENGRNPKDEMSSINFSRLVHSLRNANMQPRIFGGWNVQFDSEFDFAEQRRIDKVIRTLMIYTEEAWPELVGNLENDKYSYTFGFGGATKNYSVGQVCEQIIRNALSASYDDSVEVLVGTEVTTNDLHDPKRRAPKELQEWLKSREKKRLFELQIETIDELSSRFTLLKVDEEVKKDFLESISESRAKLKKLKVPRLGHSFIPNKEQWFYLTEEDVER